MSNTKKISELTPLDPIDLDLSKTIIPVYDDVTKTTRKVSLLQFNDAIEASIPFAEASYQQANTATSNALLADQKAMSAGNYANSSFNRANNSLNVQNGGTITGDLEISGNVTITGCTVSLQVSTLRTSDHIIDLGFGTIGTPTQNSGIRVLRGDELPVQIRWNESSLNWQYTNDGVNYVSFSPVDENTVLTAFGQANTATILAQAAFDSANSLTLSTVDIVARNTANSASDYANAAFNQANNIVDVGNYSNAAFNQANSANTLAQSAYDESNNAVNFSNVVGIYANAAYTQANIATDNAGSVSMYANAAYEHSNSAYIQANTTNEVLNVVSVYTNSAYTQANTATELSNLSGLYANSAYNNSNSAYTQANTATDNASNVGLYANAAFIQANNSFDSQNTTGIYSNSAYEQANTANNTATQSNQRAVTSGVYANSAYDLANSAVSGITTTDQRAVTSGVYANSAFLVANVADQRAVTSGVYANSAYGQSNSASFLAQSAFNVANTKVTFDNQFEVEANISVKLSYTDGLTNTSNFYAEQGQAFISVVENGVGAKLQVNTNKVVIDDGIAGPMNLEVSGDVFANSIVLYANNIISGDESKILSVANSSGDGAGATTLELVPDVSLISSDRFVIIDPTDPTHVHIRAGGTINNSSADLYLGGENSHVRIASGENPDVFITANNYTWAFYDGGELNAPGLVNAQSLSVSGEAKFTKIVENYAPLSNATGVVEHDCSNGHVFKHTNLGANFTANFTNLGLDNGETTSITLILEQGGTPYIANNVQIGGASVTIKWSANTVPTGNANAVDVQSFSIYNVGDSYTILGQLSTFG